MNREEEIEEFAQGFASLYVDDNYEAVKAGIEWADEHPRLDVAGPTSVTRVRMILLRNFMNVVKQYPDKTMDEVPEIKEAFDLVNNLDKCCEVAGFTLNDDTGFYNIPECNR